MFDLDVDAGPKRSSASWGTTYLGIRLLPLTPLGPKRGRGEDGGEAVLGRSRKWRSAERCRRILEGVGSSIASSHDKIRPGTRTHMIAYPVMLDVPRELVPGGRPVAC